MRKSFIGAYIDQRSEEDEKVVPTAEAMEVSLDDKQAVGKDVPKDHRE